MEVVIETHLDQIGVIWLKWLSYRLILTLKHGQQQTDVNIYKLWDKWNV